MNWFKNLFKKKEEIVEDKEEIIQPIIEETSGEIICEHCGFEISSQQRVKTFNGKKFHLKPCFRDIKKLAKKEAFR